MANTFLDTANKIKLLITDQKTSSEFSGFEKSVLTSCILLLEDKGNKKGSESNKNSPPPPAQTPQPPPPKSPTPKDGPKITAPSPQVVKVESLVPILKASPAPKIDKNISNNNSSDVTSASKLTEPKTQVPATMHRDDEITRIYSTSRMMIDAYFKENKPIENLKHRDGPSGALIDPFVPNSVSIGKPVLNVDEETHVKYCQGLGLLDKHGIPLFSVDVDLPSVIAHHYEQLANMFREHVNCWQIIYGLICYHLYLAEGKIQLSEMKYLTNHALNVYFTMISFDMIKSVWQIEQFLHQGGVEKIKLSRTLSNIYFISVTLKKKSGATDNMNKNTLSSKKVTFPSQQQKSLPISSGQSLANPFQQDYLPESISVSHAAQILNVVDNKNVQPAPTQNVHVVHGHQPNVLVGQFRHF